MRLAAVAAKHPTLGDMPWVLARPMAPGIFAFVPFYPQMLRDGRVNRSDGLVLWKIGTRIVWSATGEVVAQRLDGRGRFRVALAAGDGGAAFEPSFPSTGCWRLTLLAGSARVSATVDVPAPGCWLFRLRTGRVAGVLVVRAIDRR